jgi:hypothetical protein
MALIMLKTVFPARLLLPATEMANSVNVPMEIEVLVFAGCPHADASIALI